MYKVVTNHVRRVLAFMEEDLLVDTACDLFANELVSKVAEIANKALAEHDLDTLIKCNNFYEVMHKVDDMSKRG